MQEMAGFHPDLAALRTSLGAERAAGREPQPGLHLEAFAGLMEIAIQRQHLGATWQAHRDHRSGSPALQAHLFAAVAKQRNELDPRSAGSGPIGHSAGIDLHLRSIGEIGLPELDKQDASRHRAGRVTRGRRIADVRAGRELAVLILEHAFEDEKFLPAVMRMRGEMATRCVANDRRGSGHLSPMRSSMRRSTPAIGEATQGSRRAWTATRREKSVLSSMLLPGGCTSARGLSTAKVRVRRYSSISFRARQ